MDKFLRFLKEESGATAIEYGLIAAGIGLVLVATLPLINDELTRVFESIGETLASFQ